MSQSLDLSIVVPIWGVEKYVVACVESLKTLSVQFEVVLVDDHTPDRSIELAMAALKGFANVSLVRTDQNRGLSVARNLGLEVARGQFVHFLDSDDYVAPNLLSDMVRQAQNEQADLLCGKFVPFYDLTGDWLPARPDTPQTAGETSGVKVLFRELRRRSFRWEAQSVLIRREFLMDSGLRFEPGLIHEDMDLVPRLYAAAGRVVMTNQPFYFYRKRENSISTTKSERRLASLLQIIDRYRVLKSREGRTTAKKAYALVLSQLARDVQILSFVDSPGAFERVRTATRDLMRIGFAGGFRWAAADFLAAWAFPTYMKLVRRGKSI